MWRAAGLEEPNAKGAGGSQGARGANDEVSEGEVNNATAGGFISRWGRYPNGRPTVIPPYHATASPVADADTSPAGSPAGASPAADADASPAGSPAGNMQTMTALPPTPLLMPTPAAQPR